MSDESRNVWFVRRDGHDTLGTGHREPYKLINVRQQGDFHEEFGTQITAAALSTAALLVKADMRADVLEKGLRDVGTKLMTLLEGNTIREPKSRAALSAALGETMQTLGTREPATDHLEQAVEIYREAITI